jgi:SOS-response transcriptional repressor LexA
MPVERSGGVGLAAGFGDRLKDRRLRLGLSLREAAERAGCTKGYLSLLERGKRGAPTERVLAGLERALEMEPGSLGEMVAMQSTPAVVREELAQRREQGQTARQLAALLRGAGPGGLDRAFESGALAKLVERISPSAERAGEGERVGALLPRAVPLINLVPAGQAAEFTDLGYPARVADSYVAAPELGDPDAFAARVTGDSMEPTYVEGDVVIFSPGREVKNGMDCFARLIEPDSETTFKRVYFERSGDGEELIRLQPLNPKYQARVEPRERVAGLYPAVSVTRRVGE